MKIRNYIFVFFVAFSTTFFLASCLNEENKIPPNCYDGLLNNGEEKIDCGGPCEECDHCENGIWDPERGETWRDCGGRCPECPTCANGVLDPGEAAIDCGGAVELGCPPCTELCGDGLLNGQEQEIDCGPGCDPCPTCTDTFFNGDEFGIDCGGPDCPPCTTTGNCGNGATDGDEYWVDCGGSHCPACDLSFTWRIGNLTHVVPVPGGTINGAMFETTGISLNDGTLFIRLIDSTPPFTSGQSFTANPANAATVLVTYTNNMTGDFYSSEFTGSSLSVSMQRYYEDVSDATPPLPTKTYVRVTFNGNLKTDGTTPLNLNIQNGVYINLFQ
jgi:hypothetical protein